MNISPKRLMKISFTIPFIIMLTISVSLMVTPPYDANTVFGIVLLVILSLTLILGRRSLLEWFKQDEFRHSVKN